MVEKGSARAAYDCLAASYDAVTSENDYELWLGAVLLPELMKHGLRTGWALDAGCGTGRAFDPLLSRGWKIVGCDLSPKMLAVASQKFGSEVRLLNADVRELPAISTALGLPGGRAFDLVLLLNDVVNYVTEVGDLVETFRGVRQNLKPEGGIAAFDVNTVGSLRTTFGSEVSEEMSARGLHWRGLTPEVMAGGMCRARVTGPGIELHEHLQRHWPIPQVVELLRGAGLACCAILGQRERDGRILLSASPDEERDHKIIFVARRSDRP